MFDEPKFTRLTLEQSDKKIVWEVPYEDVGGDDLMEAINTVMIGLTFTPDSVIHCMAGFIEGHGQNLYDIYDHIENEKEGD